MTEGPRQYEESGNFDVKTLKTDMKDKRTWWKIKIV